MKNFDNQYLFSKGVLGLNDTIIRKQDNVLIKRDLTDDVKLVIWIGEDIDMFTRYYILLEKETNVSIRLFTSEPFDVESIEGQHDSKDKFISKLLETLSSLAHVFTNA